MAVDNVYGEPLFSWQLSFNREHARGHIALSRRAAIQPVRVGAVKRESEPFLRLGLCSAAWLGHSMPLPRQAQLQSELAGVGPPLDTILPGQPHLAAVISGYFAARAGLPVEEASPEIRALQRAELQLALAWALIALGLPPLGARDSAAEGGH